MPYFNPHPPTLCPPTSVKISVEDVERDWMDESGPADELIVAKHYDIYKHLFDGASFMPVVKFRLLCNSSECVCVYECFT